VDGDVERERGKEDGRRKRCRKVGKP